MKIVDLLEVAGDFPLTEFRWGEDLVKYIHRREPKARAVKVEDTGEEILLALEVLDSQSYDHILDDYLELKIVARPDYLPPLKRTVLFLILLIGFALLGTFSYEAFTTGKMPSGQILLDLSRLLLELFSL